MNNLIGLNKSKSIRYNSMNNPSKYITINSKGIKCSTKKKVNFFYLNLLINIFFYLQYFFYIF